MLKTSADNPRFTYGDYRRWTGDERWELIDGAAHLMSPAPTRRHQKASLGLAVQIANALDGLACEVYSAPFDVRLPERGQDDDAVMTVVQPDLSVICDPGKLDAAGCRGAPDWIIEISSPSTSARDRVEKRGLYERHGVGEYWVLEPGTGELTVHRRSTEDSRFDEVWTGAARERRGPRLLAHLDLDWDRILEV